MRRSAFIALAVTVGVATAGCSAITPGTATAPSVIQPWHRMTYAPQVVLPFGRLIVMLAGVAVDAADNLYVLDFYGQVWEMAAGAGKPTKLPFTDLGQSVNAAADAAGNLYVTDILKNRVLKLAPGTTSPTVLPFTDLHRIAGVAVDTAGNVYVSDAGSNRVLSLAPGATSPIVLPFNNIQPRGVAVDTGGNIYVADSGGKRVLSLAPGADSPTVLPFNDLKLPSAVAVDTRGNV